MRTIRVNVDRLVLDGLGLSQKEARIVQRAFETHLSELVHGGGLSRLRGGALASIQVGSPLSGQPGEIGKQLAVAVSSGLGGKK